MSALDRSRLVSVGQPWGDVKEPAGYAGLGFEPEADGGDSGVTTVEAVARALGPGDCPAGNGGETRGRAWAPGAARLAGPGGEVRAGCWGASPAVGRERGVVSGSRGKQGLGRSELWPASCRQIGKREERKGPGEAGGGLGGLDGSGPAGVGGGRVTGLHGAQRTPPQPSGPRTERGYFHRH